MRRQNVFNVFRNGKCIDKVFYPVGYTFHEEEVRASLIKYNQYPADIMVARVEHAEEGVPK